MNKTKQVIVMRTDLNMRLGKMIAQGCHASLGVFTHLFIDTDEPLIKKIVLIKAMMEWLLNSFTKICVGCKGEDTLHDLKLKAEELGIPCCLVLDNGQTEFKQECPKCKGTGNEVTPASTNFNTVLDICSNCKGTGKVNKPTYTCIAIGPDYSDRIDILTKDFKLL